VGYDDTAITYATGVAAAWLEPLARAVGKR
jgi:hypothetical protein